MKTKILNSLMTAVCLFFYIGAAKGFQTKEILNETTSKEHLTLSSNQQDSIIPLICEAPVNPSWLNKGKEEPDTRKTFEEPTVRVAYVIPSNRTPQPKGVAALQKIIRTGRDFFKQEMTYNGFGPKTFRYETASDGETPFIHVVNIPETDEQIRGANNQQLEAWRNTINALMNVGIPVWEDGQVWLVVAETHLQEPNGNIIGDIALGSGSGCTASDPGLAILNSTLLTSIANGTLTDNRSYHGVTIPEIGPYPLKQNISFPWFEGSTMSSVTSSTLGAFVHEMSHALGIYHHDFRNDANFHGNLMGNGLRGIRGHIHPNQYPEDYTRLAYATALALDTNHYFNTGKERNQIDDISISLASSTPKDGKMAFDIKASDTDGLSMLQLFSLSGLSVEKVLQGTRFEGQIETPYFEPGAETTFRVKLYDKQGNKTERSVTLTPNAGNRAPWPFLHFRPAIGEAGGSFELDAGLSRDPDGNSQLTFEWDFFYDDIFDTPPTNYPKTILAPPGGNHLIRIKVTDPSGSTMVSTPVAMHVNGAAPPHANVNFTLINAATNEVIPGFDPIAEGAALNLFHLPSELNIRANVPSGFNSVRFDLDGMKNIRVENVEPFALFGDHEGDYFKGELSLGTHLLSATPYQAHQAKGAPSNTSSLEFSITKNSTNFILVDAETDEDLFKIDDSMVIEEYSIIDKKLNIRTSHDLPLEGLSVRFSINSLDGTVNRVWTERAFPYTIFGDFNGNYNGVQLPAGKYHILAVFDYKDDPGFEIEPSVELNFEIEETRVSHFTLFTPNPYLVEGDEFNTSGQVFPFSSEPSTIKAVTRGGEVGSVKISVNGPITHSRIENVFPYSLFGDMNGIFDSRVFPIGDYEITATPFSKANGQGVAGKPLTISFKIDFPDEYGVTLVRIHDVTSGSELANMDFKETGTVIDATTTPTNNATIVVNWECDEFDTCPPSVLLELEGPLSISRIENVQPYTLFGDLDGVMTGEEFPVGDYILKITPFTGSNATGNAIQTITRSFQIIETAIPLSLKTTLFPNPARTSAFVEIDENKSILKTVVLDMSGSKVQEYSGFNTSIQHLNLSELVPGIYIVQIYSGQKIVTKKLVVR